MYDNLDNIYKIYACLNNKKRVAIFNFDLNNCKLEKSDILEITKSTEIIKSGFGFGHFKKAIQLPNELVATSDDDNEIDIWIKDKENDDGYTHLNNIILDYDIADILSVNSEYFISSHCNEKKINYYDIESLSIKKSLDNIDCLSTQDSLLLFNVQYIIINCKKGFTLIYIKTKELVQYIEDYIDKYETKEFFLNFYGNIIIMYVNSENNNNKEINIFNAKFTDSSFQIVEKFTKKFITSETLHLTCIDEDNLMLWDKKIYLLE